MEKKRTIKWNQSGLWPEDPVYEDINRIFLNDVKHLFNFELSDNPDFLFVSNKEDFKFLEYDCIRIFHSDENIHPDFHLFDYVIGYPSNLSFGDRYCYCLSCLENLEALEQFDSRFSFKNIKKQTKKDLELRNYFCDFVYHHDSGSKRSKYFNLLNSYKEVSSLGQIFKSINKPEVEKITYIEKLNFEKKCKFSICIESCDDSKGLITEKIFHSLLAGSIPIYLGDPRVVEIVNPKRFINISDFRSDEELLNRIKEIDNNDELFLEIVNEQPLNDMEYFAKSRKRLNNFLINIFSQDPHCASRRPKVERYWTERLDGKLRSIDKPKEKGQNIFKRMLRKVFR